MPKIKTDDELREELFNYINLNGFPIEKNFGENGLSNIGVFRNHFKKWHVSDIVKECGMSFTEIEKVKMDVMGCNKRINIDISKDYCIYIILKMTSVLNRPLAYDDFRESNYIDNIPIAMIRKYWGTMNNMKRDIGLEITQEDMVSRKTTFEEIKEDISHVCYEVEKEGRRVVVLIHDIKKYGKFSLSIYRKYFKESNLSIRDYIRGIGYDVLDSGRGCNYIYGDGEKVFSYYEKEISDILRDFGLKFNKDYYRDIKYSSFISDYNGMMTCDYFIIKNNIQYYVEVAGVLRNYENFYKNNLEITSKSKKEYAQKLKIKENMFLEKHLNYHIVFPHYYKKDYLSSFINFYLNNEEEIIIK